LARPRAARPNHQGDTVKPIAICLGAALAVSAAHATDLAKWKNDGAVLVLTNEAGTCKTGANIIRSIRDQTEQREGCYTLDPQTVHIVWTDGAAEKLPIKKFRPTREAVTAAQKERMETEKDLIDVDRREQTPLRALPPPQPQAGG
jgi:hypothetical protein